MLTCLPVSYPYQFYPEAFTVLCTSDSTLSYFEKLRRVAFTLKLKREPKDYKDGWDLDIPSMLKMERLHKTVILFAGLYARYVQDALAKPGIIADFGPLLYLDRTPFLPHTCGMWDATTPFSSFAAATTHSCSCLIRAFYHFEICCDLHKAKRSLTTEVALPKVMTAGVLLRGRYGRNLRLLVPGLLTEPQQWHLHCVLLFLLRTVSVPGRLPKLYGTCVPSPRLLGQLAYRTPANKYNGKCARVSIRRHRDSLGQMPRVPSVATTPRTRNPRHR